MKTLYKAWPGRNRFLPWGCIIGPIEDTCANVYVYCCFIGALIPYCIFILPKIWLISPAIPILFLICLVITVLFLMLTQCSDPGIIPRRPYLEREASKFERYLIEGRSNEADLVHKTNFCETCKIFRPRRASHCSVCQNCVEVFDHHCPFVNNCIGKRNYRFFVLFLAGIVLSMIAFLVNLIIFGINMAGTQINSLIVIILCSIAAAVVGIPLVGFLLFHIVLAVTGKTTREVIKNINEESQENQWCRVDPPLMNYFEEINESSFKLLEQDLEKLSEYNRSIILNEVAAAEYSSHS